MTRLVLKATAFAVFYMVALMMGAPGIGATALEIAATACTAVLIYEAIAHDGDGGASPADALAFAAASGILNIGSMVTGGQAATTTSNAFVLVWISVVWMNRHKKDKRT